MNTLTSVRQSRPRSRGQALVLSALGMVLLVLMVCMTLSFGTKAKAKMELQVVADQAAYSTSVATARTYNLLAMTNRVMIAHMTAMLGIQSAISFATSYFVLAQSLLIYYSLEILNQLRCCKWSCAYYGCFTALYVFLTRWLRTLIQLVNLIGRFPMADQRAAAQAQRTSIANNIIYLGQSLTMSMHLYGALRNQSTASRVVGRAAGTSPDWNVPSNADKVAKREAGYVAGAGSVGLALGVGAINQTNLILTDRHAVVASMGSRGHFFTAFRDSWFIPNGVRNILQQGLQRLGAQNDWRGQWLSLGKGYFGDFFHSDSILPTSSKFALADDHFVGVFRYSGPSAVRPLTIPTATFVTVMSNNSFGFHAGIGLPGIWIDMLHTVPAVCLLNCPSAWTNFADYNVGLPQHVADNRGVPKAPVIVARNAGNANPDPFNLMFNFRFTGTGKTFDLAHSNGAANGGGIQVRNGASGTTDISQQVGYSTGITYFHRANHWKEPPNLFNPYFRAGLTRADTDRAATSISLFGIPLSSDNSHDIEDTMNNAGVGWAASAYSALYNQGYQGITP